MTIGVLDIIIAIIFVASGIVVAMTGFFKELGAKASYFVGFLFSMMFTNRLSALVIESIGIKEGLVVVFVTYLVLFYVGFFACRMLASVLTKATDTIGLTFLNRGLGFLLGIIEAFVCITFVLWVLQYQTLINVSAILESSFLYNNVFTRIYEWISATGITNNLTSIVGK